MSTRRPRASRRPEPEDPLSPKPEDGGRPPYLAGACIAIAIVVAFIGLAWSPARPAAGVLVLAGAVLLIAYRR
jgi:hypothetical protein